MPEGTMVWAERREGQSAWEAAGVFLEGLGEMSGAYSGYRARLAGLLGAEDWEEVVASVLVELPDGTQAWADRRDGQSVWEAAGAFLEGLGGGHGDLGHNRESLARQLEARDVRVAMVEVEMPDGTTRVAGIRAGQTAWEAAGAFLAGLGDTFGDLRHNRVTLARRLDAADPRPVVSRVSVSLPGGARVEASMREGQRPWDLAGAWLEELRVEGADAPWGQAELTRRLDVARRPVAARVEVELGDGRREWAELREGQTAWEAAGAFLDGLGGVDGAPGRAVLDGLLDAADPRPVVARVEVKLGDGTSAWAEMREGQSAWAAAGAFLGEARARHGGVGVPASRVDLARRLHGDLRSLQIPPAGFSRRSRISDDVHVLNRYLLGRLSRRPTVARTEVPLPDGTLGWAEMHEGQTAWEAAGAFFEGLGWSAGELDDLWDDRVALADELDPSWRPVVARTEVGLADGAAATAEVLWGQTAWEAAESFLGKVGRNAVGAGLDAATVADWLDAEDVRPVVARVETELADGTMGWAEMRGGQSAWAAAGSFLDRTGRDRVGEDWDLRRASLAGSLTEAWTAATIAGDGSYGSVSGTVEVAGESFAYAGTLPEGAPWVACVLTTPDAADRRRWVRETLGRHVPVVFLVGRGGVEEGDTLVFDVEERYSNPRSSLTVKWFGCMQAVLRHRPETRYVLKVDHDTALDFAELRREAEALVSPVYLGKIHLDAIPIRDPKHAHFFSHDDFAPEVFPMYTAGFAFAVDIEAARRLLDVAQGERVFLQEDYWVGILAEKADFRPMHGWFRSFPDQPPPPPSHLPRDR